MLTVEANCGGCRDGSMEAPTAPTTMMMMMIIQL